ncbi:MAG: endonuclease/exonuclease/phosphatase family protein [Bacilli bacterium]|nr:endonuclease/exonuclease/phosphatase family protein [Bacilli bacterium]
MQKVKVMTFNVRNNSERLFYNNKENSTLKKAQILSNFIVDNNIDIIGAQELVRKYVKILKNLLIGYNFAGEYRRQKKKFISLANESNSIITRYKIIRTKTFYLPYFPKNKLQILKNYLDIAPRIMTMVLLELENKKRVYVFNTHLNYEFSDVQKRQLDKVLKILKKYNDYPIILTGDFNMNTDFYLFKEFVDNLKKIGINIVDINESTNIGKDVLPIDRIFISKHFYLSGINVGNEILNNISDHKPVIVELELI